MRSEFEPTATIAVEPSRIADYIALMKPELTFLSVITAMAGVFLASPGSIPFGGALHVLIGTTLLGGGAGALNQLIEREYDGMMRRTGQRPLPSGRLSPAEVLVFGTTLSLLGILDLTLFTNFLTGFLAVVTLVTYLFLYTPLKRITPWSTVVGGIPGALPPVIGWTAVRNGITPEAWVLFAVLFFWQMPHFLSLAWIYRKDYARAGYKLLTVVDPSGSTASIHMIVCSTLLLIASIAQGVLGDSGVFTIIALFLLGTGFIAATVHLSVSRSNEAARRVFFASLIYLPALLLVMIIDKL